MIVCALRDNVAEVFSGSLAVFRNEAEAVRCFSALVALPADQQPPNIRDLELYRVGSYDERLGKLEPGQKFLANYLSAKVGDQNA